jgi:hypothetical protein
MLLPLPPLFAVAIHCLGHHCGVVVVMLCCHWVFLPSPETASVGELSTYSNVGIFLKVLQAGVFFKFCGKKNQIVLTIQIISLKSGDSIFFSQICICCLMIHHTL